MKTQTEQNYDAVPYEDCPLMETHPDYLAVAGRLFGVQSAAPDRCRVLELGCASGGNLIPMVYYWPDSEFVGVELSKNQAAQGNEIIRELQLNNITILQRDILDLDASLGLFDYIIVHGVYSWVPVDVQQHILKLCRTLLLPNGIAYVSYNTLPGWNLRFSLREMMQYRSRHADSREEKIAQSLEMLRMLERGLPDNSSLSEKWLKEEVKSLLRVTPSYLLHDYLEVNNRPVYFSDFMRSAAAQRLQYLCEAHLYAMLSSTLSAQAAEDLESIDDLIEYEQYLDFFYVRYFRQTLLCHESLDLTRELEMDQLRTYYFTANLSCEDEIDLSSPTAQKFKDPKGTSYTITQPITKAALVDLTCIYPNSRSFDQLTAQAQAMLQEHGAELQTNGANALLAELFNLYLSQGLRLSLVQREFANEFGLKPKASALARVYAGRQKCCMASVHHASVELDDLDIYLISLLNGEKTVLQLQLAVSAKAEQDAEFRRQLSTKGIRFPIDGALLSSNIEQLLYHYARLGLLQPAD